MFETDFLEDMEVFFPLLFACRTFAVVDEVFFQRRNRNNSTMAMPPNEKHVNGVLKCIQSSLWLYTARDLSNRERWHVRKRLESYCIRYVLTARHTQKKARLSVILGVILKTKSPTIAVKSFVFFLRADQSDTVRLIWRSTKKAVNLLRFR